MLKFHHPTGRVAVRSTFPEDGWNAWLIADPASGAHWATVGEVADWTDVPIPKEAP